MLYLIDIDGTMLLSGGAGFVALNRAFVELHGVEDAMRDVRPAGKTDPAIVDEGFEQRLGRLPTDTERAAVLERYLAHLPEAVRQSTRFQILDGVPSGLDRLAAAGHTLGLATGNLREGARIKLERPGLWSRFSFGGYGDDHALRPALVRIAAERGAALIGQPLDPDQVCVVGDTDRDVEAARAHGFRVVGVASPAIADHRRLEASCPDRIVTTLDDL